jgi:hypothetical protein
MDTMQQWIAKASLAGFLFTVFFFSAVPERKKKTF